MTRFYFDFETFLFQPGCLAPPLVCMSYAFDKEAGQILHANFDRGKMSKLLLDVLRDKSVELVAYNGASMEAVCLLAWRTEWCPVIMQSLRDGRWRDPFLAERLARIAGGDFTEVGNLKDSLDHYMIPNNLNKESPWRLRYGSLWGTPVKDWPSEAVSYSLSDLAVRELHLVQQQRINPEYLVDEPSQARAAFTLSLTSCWGFPVDISQARVLVEDTKVQIEKSKQTLLSEGLLEKGFAKGKVKFTRKKAPAVARLLSAYEAMGREPPRGDLTVPMLLKAYKEEGLNPPRLGPRDKIKSSHIQAALKAGVPQIALLGNYSLDEEACLNSGDELLKAYTHYGQADTLLKKVQRIQRAGEADKPVQTYYSTLMATGRTSSSQGKDPKPGQPYSTYGAQMQNLPRSGEEYKDEQGKKKTRWGARECFVAPGYSDYLKQNPEWAKVCLLEGMRCDLKPSEVIVSVDFDAFEMRTWGQSCLNILGYSDLATILNDTRRCPHVEMGCRLYDSGANYVDVEDWSTAYAWAYGLKKSDPSLFKRIRGLAKGPNFGLPGGMGAERLMDYCRLNYGVVLTLETAKFACDTWREMYREAQPYLDYISDTVLGGVRGAKGKVVQFVSGRVRGGVGFCDASNGFFQGLAADAAKASGWALIEEAYERVGSPFYGSRPLAFVHDEWLFAVRRDRLHEAAHRMRDVQLAAAQKYCPDVILTAQPAAMYRWSKAAGDPCYDKNSELIPYEESL